MNPKQNDADETEPPYPREHPGLRRGYSWRDNNGDRYATAGEHFHGVTYDTNVQTHVSTGESFFTLYLSYYVNALRNGEALPRERNVTGKW